MSDRDMTHYVGDNCPGRHRDMCGTPGFNHYWSVGTRTMRCLLCGAINDEATP